MPFEEEELLHGPAALWDDEEFDDLPPCPGTLVIVDVQEEFNKSIGFDTRAFLAWLRQCAEGRTDIHVVYDELGDEPAMFAALGPTYYAKSYGADPYERGSPTGRRVRRWIPLEYWHEQAQNRVGDEAFGRNLRGRRQPAVRTDDQWHSQRGGGKASWSFRRKPFGTGSQK